MIGMDLRAAGPAVALVLLLLAAPAAAQGERAAPLPPLVLPPLVLPPGASTEPQGFPQLMRQGDTALVRGDVLRARALYERAAALHPASAAAPIAAGKTWDPTILPLFGADPGLGDPARARAWYERARALGDRNAEALLAALR